MIKKIFLDTFYSSESESLKALQGNSKKINVKVILVCIGVAFSLSIIKYFSDYRFVVSLLNDFHFNSSAIQFQVLMTMCRNSELYQLVYWVSIIIFFYLIPPILIVVFVFKENLNDYGLTFKGAFKDYKLYVIMLIVMIPLVLFFSGTQSFQARYPFYDIQKGESFFPNFIIWEVLYFFQFFALEFFFRGFMVHGTKQRFGFFSVFVMTIPYCMIHFGKPMPETIAAIIAGIVLGVLSLKSKSIWMGVAIHCSVAVTMDVCALWQKGIL